VAVEVPVDVHVAAGGARIRVAFGVLDVLRRMPAWSRLVAKVRRRLCGRAVRGIDLGQIIPELVTNADAAIAASGREQGRIELSFAQPEPAFLKDWRAQTRTLGVPALADWRWEVRCRDDGISINAPAVDRRLGALGELPEHDGAQRSLFGRGLRDVWLAQGAGRIAGPRGPSRGVVVFPAAGDDPCAYVHICDQEAAGVAAYTLVTVPLATGRLPADVRLPTCAARSAPTPAHA
jgi:hypothetical protein